MAVRNLDAMPQPFRWLAACQAAWSLLAAVTPWARSRVLPRVHMSRVSDDWLQEFERQSTRTREL
jgi:hypothetical protein